ncbi:hypothetical protein CF326_g3535 [Tilletia indica]|nr:hypothetical protein CF326_g3535 [Tilletia indica]
MSTTPSPGTAFATYWRRTDVPHLTLHDRIHWVMQWVFNDPHGHLHGGRLATVTSASRELVWIARTFGQEPEQQTDAFDERMQRTWREHAIRARQNGVHRMGTSSRSYRKSKHPGIPSAPLASSEGQMMEDDNASDRSITSSAAVSDMLPADDVEENDASDRSATSSTIVSDMLPAEHVEASHRHEIDDDGVSLQTRSDAREFWVEQYARGGSDEHCFD